MCYPIKSPGLGLGTECEVSSPTCEFRTLGKSLHLSCGFVTLTYKMKGLSHRISKALSSAICPGF